MILCYEEWKIHRSKVPLGIWPRLDHVGDNKGRGCLLQSKETPHDTVTLVEVEGIYLNRFFSMGIWLFGGTDIENNKKRWEWLISDFKWLTHCLLCMASYELSKWYKWRKLEVERGEMTCPTYHKVVELGCEPRHWDSRTSTLNQLNFHKRNCLWVSGFMDKRTYQLFAVKPPTGGESSVF